MVRDRRAERGIALVYVGIFLVVICLVVGLAVDLGRAYAVRLQLATAVDAAALAAARIIPNGQDPARREAEEIFALNFPAEALIDGDAPTPTVKFGTVPDGPNRGAHLVTVSATVPLPTTFIASRETRSCSRPPWSRKLRSVMAGARRRRRVKSSRR